jgi:helicase MOV-10
LSSSILSILLDLLPIHDDSTVSLTVRTDQNALTDNYLIVAITRAKALLIVIGDPTVLGLDPLWRSFLNYIHGNGGWTGKKMSWDPEADVRGEGGYDKEIRDEADKEMSELIERMRGVGVGDEEDQMEGNFDRPWREEE